VEIEFKMGRKELGELRLRKNLPRLRRNRGRKSLQARV